MIEFWVLTFLRTLMLLALVLWIGGIVFFSAVEAPAVFRVVGAPELRHLAGEIVSRSLTSLHYIGLTCGVIFILCSIAMRAEVHRLIVTGEQVRMGAGRGGGLSILLALVMMALTALSQFGITPRLHRIRGEAAASAEFDRLHRYSTYTEGAVLLLGVGVVILTARRRG